MEYYPIDPGNYGITVAPTRPATNYKDLRRKRQRDESSGDVSPTSTTASVAAKTSRTAGQRIGEPGEVKEIREATDAPSSSSKAAVNPVATAAPTSPPTDLADAKNLEKLAERQQRREERWKRNTRAAIARELGHEVDSDGEHQYWEECRARSREEEARREALSPEARRQEDIKVSANVLRDHIKPRLAFDTSGLPHLYHYPLFVLQTAPRSQNGAGCRLPHCTVRIAPGDYRIALSPGQNFGTSPDYYHVKCFEELLDLSSPYYMARFVPHAQKHGPDRGASCILKEYISRWKIRMQPRKANHESQNHGEEPKLNTDAEQGIAETPSAEGQSSMAETTKLQTPAPETPTESAMPEQAPTSSTENPTDPTALSEPTNEAPPTSSENAAADVWIIADALWEFSRQAAAEASHEQTHLYDLFDRAADANDVANASADQDQSWRITQYLLPESDPDYDERHALSQALSEWKDDIFVATTNIDELSKELSLGDDDELIQDIRRRKEELGELSMKRIDRYSI